MRRLLWWTLLLSLVVAVLPSAKVQAQAGGLQNFNNPYLLNSAQRRALPSRQPGKQPGSGTSAVLNGLVKNYRKEESTDLTPAPQRERTTLSDWELVQLWMQDDAPFPDHWKTHRGTAAESLVLVEVQGEGGSRTRYSGLVVRCDGFLMVPQPVWDAVKEKRPVQVLVTQAEGEDETGPFLVRHRNLHKSRQKDFHFVKLNDHHLRCLPVLASWNLAKGTALQVVWGVLGAGGTLEARSVPAVCSSVPTEVRGTLGALTYEGGAAPTDIPSGAVVVDRESGAALGMITEGRRPTEFSTTRLFGDLCAEVALAPDRDAARGKDPQDAGMVKVPGGPVVYDEKEFVNTYQTAIACTPDFYCDKYLVTIGEWQEFLSVRKDRPLPEGWDARNRRFPPTLYPKLPVTGPTAGDMKDYAALHHKRLITTVEWMLAAKTSSLDWLERLEAEAEGIRTAILTAQGQLQSSAMLRVQRDLAKREQTAASPGVAGQALRNGADFQGSILDLTQAFAKTLEQIRQTNQKFIARLPGQPHEPGSIGEDKSDLGIFDVTMNVPEACLGWANNYAIAPKLLPAGQDPFTSEVYFAGNLLTDTGSAIGGIWGTVAGAGLDNPIVWAAVWKTQFGGKDHDQPTRPGAADFELASLGPRFDAQKNKIIGDYVLDIASKCNLGFRCAR